MMRMLPNSLRHSAQQQKIANLDQNNMKGKRVRVALINATQPPRGHQRALLARVSRIAAKHHRTLCSPRMFA
jgi:hypothetical protein